MATTTRIGRKSKAHLYVREHVETAIANGLSIEAIAGRIGVVRQTVWKWVDQPQRLEPSKLIQLADALDLDDVTDLWRPPGKSILDLMSEDELEATAIEITKRLRRRA